MGDVAWPTRVRVLLCCSLADLKMYFLSVFGKSLADVEL